ARLYIKHQRSVAHAANLLYAVANLFEHLAQFAIAAFDQDNLVPGIVAFANLANASRSRVDLAFLRPALIDRDPAAQAVELLFIRLAGDFYQVGLLHAGSGLGQLIR